jgi:Zn2+/Cd2+-exporting ATPase
LNLQSLEVVSVRPCGIKLAAPPAEVVMRDEGEGGGPAGGEMSWSVGGMDCAGCVAKVRRSVEGLTGVSDVRVSLISESLALRLDPAVTTPDAVESVVRRLGYDIEPHGARGRAAEQGETPGSVPRIVRKKSSGAATPERPWYSTTKGRFVLATGALLAAAGITQLVLPGPAGEWAFVAATLIGLVPVARRAFAAARLGQPFTIEMLMTIAAAGALAIGAAAEAAMVVFLFAIGEVLEGVAAGRARAGIRALGALVPKTARLVVGTRVREVPANSLAIGNAVLVRPGDRVPADGEVIEGTSGIDESPVTGESVPRTKEPGDRVFAGSINAEAVLKVRVTRAPEDNTIARIIRLVEEAEAARAPTERFIDRFSRWYMPAVVGLAALVAVIPPLALGEAWDTWIYRALALLLIGCPCALVISVPASIASALSAGTRQGLLVKGGAVIEAAAATTLVAFDKTGTLTRGAPAVTDVVPLAAEERELLALAAAVEAGSSHPLAAAVLAAAEAESIGVEPASAGTAMPGRGLSGEVGGARVFVGSPRYAAESQAWPEEAAQRAAALEAEGKTVAAVFREGTCFGLFALRDEPRADAEAGLAALRGLGLRTVMLTGDNERTAAAIAGALGLEHRAGLLPDGKIAAIREMVAAERVMMVGDGINDAPALAAAHVGVAMGSGTDVALETADGALLRNRVGDVAAKIRLARATMHNIRQNIAIALGLKGVFLVTTVAGITGLWPAIMADTGATVLVTLNALRLLAFRPDDASSAKMSGRGSQKRPAASASVAAPSKHG